MTITGTPLETPARTPTPARTRALRARLLPPSAPALLLAGLATLLWSGSFVSARALHETVPPVQAVFWRWAVAAVAVAPLALRPAWRQRALIRRHLGFLTLAALFGVTLYNTLVHQAATTTSAGNMGMIMAASPVLMALHERLTGHRLGVRRTAGLLVACLGVLLLVGDGSLRPDLAAGDLWMAAAALCFASYTVLLRRRPAELGPLTFLFTTFVIGALLLAPAYAVSLGVQGGFPVTPATAGPLLYLGVLSSAVAFFAWNQAVARVGAARAGVVYYLQPVCVAGLSALLLGETTGPLQLLCAALILGGVALGAAGRRAG